MEKKKMRRSPNGTDLQFQRTCETCEQDLRLWLLVESEISLVMDKHPEELVLTSTHGGKKMHSPTGTGLQFQHAVSVIF
jgi:hypothetical protein